jgi:type III restriction enzyme
MSFTPKEYQRRVLDAWRDFTGRLGRGEAPEAAFAAVTATTWGRPLPYRPSPCLAAVPVACLRIPTGGGKTFVAAAACGIAASAGLLGAGGAPAVVVWLVPSTAIAEQTLRALQDARHPTRQALVGGVAGHAGLGPTRVVDLAGALSLPAADYRAGAVVVVATIQNFRVDDTDQREVYRQAGALMSHDAQDPRLAQILARMRPLVIVDEAHNARTDKSFDALARLSPGLVLEITATPVREGGSRLASNQLISVSAAELHAEHMLKLPLGLAVAADPQHCLARALAQRAELAQLAEADQRAGAGYLRPLLLIQAQARKPGAETLTPEVVKARLLADHGVPERAIRIATGSIRELDDLDDEYPLGLYDPACPVTVIITVDALREGWDCAWAYVLCTLRATFTETGAAQILGRILRQPGATLRPAAALNRAYAVAAAESFPQALANLRDALVDSLGYERESATALAVPDEPHETLMELRLAVPVAVPAGTPLLPAQVAALPAALRQRIAVDAAAGSLSVPCWLDERERQQVASCIADPPQAAAFKAALAAANERATAAHAGLPIIAPPTPVERALVLRVPRIAVRIDRQWTLLGESLLVNREWQPSAASALLGEDAYVPRTPHFDRGSIDVTAAGRVVSRIEEGETGWDLGLEPEPDSDISRLVWWIQTRLSADDLHADDLRAWLLTAVRHLTDQRRIPIATLALDQAGLLHALEARLASQRQAVQRQAVQELLFDAEQRQDLRRAGHDLDFVFDPTGAYPASECEREVVFRKHYYRQVGAFDSSEERACAIALDALPEVATWVRNLDRRAGAFRLARRPGANGRWFYPDFVGLLGDGRALVVEYKGADRLDTPDTRDKCDAGELWARVTGGIFVLVSDRDYDAIRRAVTQAGPVVHPSWPAGYWQRMDALAGELNLGDIERVDATLHDVDPRDLEGPR